HPVAKQRHIRSLPTIENPVNGLTTVSPIGTVMDSSSLILGLLGRYQWNDELLLSTLSQTCPLLS
ncbi:hypothetical protein, partial [Candidatus Flexifilum breve]|uniref:hypothetical protein n=1 Tax=Candidatus Flexifilum breve TaxID=3140694 RepID=UPI0031CC7D5A